VVDMLFLVVASLYDFLIPLVNCLKCAGSFTAKSLLFELLHQGTITIRHHYD